MKIKNNKINKFSKILSIMVGTSLLILPVFLTNVNKGNNDVITNSNHNQLNLLNDYNLIEEAWTLSNTIIVKDTEGDIWSWGSGTGGQNGDGEEVDINAPKKIHDVDGSINVFGQGITIKEAWTMAETIIAKDTNDNIWSWGLGDVGQNGDGEAENNDEPIQITQFDETNTIVDAWTMQNTIIAKDSQDNIWSWGKGDFGENGDGELNNNNSPEQITQFNTNTIVDAWTMDNTIIAKDTVGDIWSWGNGLAGQNGDGAALHNDEPEQIHDFDGATNVFGQGITIEEAWTMSNTIIVKTTNGSVWSWGWGDYGQNGDGEDVTNNAPSQITQFNETNTIVDAWTTYNNIIAKDTAGNVWSWGHGIWGQNGDGEELNKNTPVQITKFNSANTIVDAWAMSETIIAKDTNGDVWSWGVGNFGQNGDGETTNNPEPVQITQFGSSNTIVDAWTMQNTIIAKDTLGNIWSWGSGGSGQNGDGETSNNNTPGKVFSIPQESGLSTGAIIGISVGVGGAALIGGGVGGFFLYKKKKGV